MIDEQTMIDVAATKCFCTRLRLKKEFFATWKLHERYMSLDSNKTLLGVFFYSPRDSMALEVKQGRSSLELRSRLGRLVSNSFRP